MVYNVVKLLHVLAIIFWLGGMAYTLFFVRPALACLPPPERLRTLRGLLARFLGALLAAILIALASGAWMLAEVASQVHATGGDLRIPPGWHVMAGLGVVMTAIYFYVRYALFARLSAAVDRGDWPAGARAAAQVRACVAVNLVLGVLIVAAVLL
ncbi:CopD family protein [Bordetella genomosp. 12]|uniref:CopD family protein n=1 Tax=Bordetella genomosp. 12 TaxID=463035 RepID=UPI00142D4019|nr:CopD family protein [Bordetella genomosp. 12]